MLYQTIGHPVLFQCKRENTMHRRRFGDAFRSGRNSGPITQANAQPMEHIGDGGARHIAAVVEQIMDLIVEHLNPANVQHIVAFAMQLQQAKQVAYASLHDAILVVRSRSPVAPSNVAVRTEHRVRFAGATLAVGDERRIEALQIHAEHRIDALHVQMVLGAVDGQRVREGKRSGRCRWDEELNDSGCAHRWFGVSGDGGSSS